MHYKHWNLFFGNVKKIQNLGMDPLLMSAHGWVSGTFPRSLTKQVVIRANIRSGGLRKCQQHETWRNGRLFHEFCAVYGSTWCSIHQTDYYKRKSAYTINAEGESDLVNPSGAMQPQGSGGNANNLIKMNQQGGRTIIRTKEKTQTAVAKLSNNKNECWSHGYDASNLNTSETC